MKFTLTFDDDLPSTGNKNRPGDVAIIRNCFHDQLLDLWDSHIALRQLERTARWPIISKRTEIRADYERPAYDLDNDDFQHKYPIPPLESGQIDLCEPIKRGTCVSYRPLVRRSLGLGCALDIIFLRQEDPGSLVLQGGDIDGRMKTLFDALRMPSDQEEKASGVTPTADPLQCLLESDALITDLSIKTGRLLSARTRKVNAVRLVIDVTVKILRVIPQNQCLGGG